VLHQRGGTLLEGASIGIDEPADTSRPKNLPAQVRENGNVRTPRPTNKFERRLKPESSVSACACVPYGSRFFGS
jgi:hypothetical protein